MLDNVVKTLVRDELIYQTAVELGLDRTPEYREKLAEAEAQLRAFQRQSMAALFRKYVRAKAAVPDPEARAYFSENAERIRTTVHVRQIFSKGPVDRMRQDLEDLKAGVPFEEVAAKHFPHLPPDVKPPWEVGVLHWNQIPDSWSASLGHLAPGQYSDVIEGEGGRLWIIQLADKSTDPLVTFETEKSRIIEILRERKADELYDRMLNEMRAKSEIVFPK